jgi:hypothetical protein
MNERDSGGIRAGGGPDGDGDARWSQVTQRHYDADGERELTTAIIFALAAAEGVAPAEMDGPPLYDSVDAAALEETFVGPEGSGGTVTFRYADYRVTVRSDGWIAVSEPAETDGP